MEKQSLHELLEKGGRIKVTIRSGHLGCADAQDACHEYGYLILYKTKNDAYWIDTPDEDSKNILCVDDKSYIQDIIESYEPMD